MIWLGLTILVMVNPLTPPAEPSLLLVTAVAAERGCWTIVPADWRIWVTRLDGAGDVPDNVTMPLVCRQIFIFFSLTRSGQK